MCCVLSTQNNLRSQPSVDARETSVQRSYRHSTSQVWGSGVRLLAGFVHLSEKTDVRSLHTCPLHSSAGLRLAPRRRVTDDNREARGFTLVTTPYTSQTQARLRHTLTHRAALRSSTFGCGFSKALLSPLCKREIRKLRVDSLSCRLCFHGHALFIITYACRPSHRGTRPSLAVTSGVLAVTSRSDVLINEQEQS